MKPPKDAEFQKFTNAMRDILKVSKTEIQRRIETEKKGKATAPAASVSSPTSGR